MIFSIAHTSSVTLKEIHPYRGIGAALFLGRYLATLPCCEAFLERRYRICNYVFLWSERMSWVEVALDDGN